MSDATGQSFSSGEDAIRGGESCLKAGDEAGECQMQWQKGWETPQPPVLSGHGVCPTPAPITCGWL